MLTILLKILAVIGVILLSILGVLLVLLLLVLFFPITYRIEADRKPGEDPSLMLMHVAVRAKWLLGLIRVRFLYPEPGSLIVKVLFLTVFDSAKQPSEKGGAKDRKKTDRKQKSRKKKGKEDLGTAEADGGKGSAEGSEGEAGAKAEAGTGSDTLEVDVEESGAAEAGAAEFEAIHAAESDFGQTEHPEPENAQAEADSETFASKREKIGAKAREISDKARNIKENIEYYREIFLCKDTRALLDHAFMRLGRILKSIRPRRLKADVLFGTGSPDTTGYILGVYGMFSPQLGRSVDLTPDFERAVLEGELFASGHITVCKLLWHGLRLVLDKKLWGLIRKLKQKKA